MVKSDKNTLYVRGRSADLDELFGSILNHFGVDAELSDFKIEFKEIVTSRMEDFTGVMETVGSFIVVTKRGKNV